MASIGLSDRDAVLKAIAECDRLGRDPFLHKYGYQRAYEYFLVHNGREYDSKAILGVAHKYENGKALGPREFSGGTATAVRVLEGLGFKVRRAERRPRLPEWTDEERVLALDVFQQSGPRASFSSRDGEVRELSDYLRSRIVFPKAVRADPRFRSPAEVREKLTSFNRLVHPPKKLTKRAAQYQDVRLWTQWHRDAAGLHIVANSIRGGSTFSELGLQTLGDASTVGPRPTFLLTWNAEKWDWNSAGRTKAIRRTAAGKHSDGRWATGNRRKGIAEGDRAFLLQQGSVRGLVASGTFTSEIFQEPHWDGTRGKVANYARVRWDRVLRDDDMIDVDELKQRVSGLDWDHIQASGVLAPATAAERLEVIWAGATETFTSPEEDGAEPLTEGEPVRVKVNRYERNPKARAACLAYYGATCQVCDLDFPKRYGGIGDGFIHVHHLKEMSTIGTSYNVDPIEDLRPVCPNCHAMLHTRKPAFTIEELKARMRNAT